MTALGAMAEAARGQFISFARAPITTILALVLPLNLMLLMSLFALTGYNAPTGLVMGEDTMRARAFVQALRDAHHSFALRPMSRERAHEQLRRARLVAVIEVPAGFDSTIAARRPAVVTLTIDNVNLDMAEDVRRAVPAAAAIFADRLGLRGVRIRPRLINMIGSTLNKGPRGRAGGYPLALDACLLRRFPLVGNRNRYAVGDVRVTRGATSRSCTVTNSRFEKLRNPCPTRWQRAHKLAPTCKLFPRVERGAWGSGRSETATTCTCQRHRTLP